MRTETRTREGVSRSKQTQAYSLNESARGTRSDAKVARFKSGRKAEAADVIEQSKKGLRINQLKAIQAKSPFSKLQWAGILDMTPRTLQRQEQGTQPLDTARSERVLLIEQLLEHGSEVFGDDDAFALWLQAPNWPLNGKRPVDLLDTATGIQLVDAAITRIEYGVFA